MPGERRRTRGTVCQVARANETFAGPEPPHRPASVALGRANPGNVALGRPAEGASVGSRVVLTTTRDA